MTCTTDNAKPAQAQIMVREDVASREIADDAANATLSQACEWWPVSFVRDDKSAFVSPSDDDYDQETGPRTSRGSRETADACSSTWNPQLNALQQTGACGKQHGAREQLQGAQISNSQQAAGDKIREKMLEKIIS
jgi:hypothetical protein